MPKTLRVLFALTVTAIAICATTAAAHGAPPADVVQATPADGSQLAPKGGYYMLPLGPGQSVTQQVTVTNPNSHAVVVDLSGVDAFTSGATGASYGTPSSTPTAVGKWVSFVTRQMQLQPGEHRSVPFTVTVPSDIGPGQYLAAISISVPLGSTPSTLPAQGRNATFKVTLQPQRILAVEVDVPGPRAPHLSVRGVKPVVQGDALRLQFDIANTGNAFAKGRGTITVPETNTRRDFTIDTFVAHTAIKYAVPWTKDVVPGSHPVTIRLEDQTGRIVTWSGMADVSGSVGDKLQRDLSGAKGARVAKSSSSSSLRWLAFLIVPVCIAAAVHLRRRRSAAHAQSPSTDGGTRSRGTTATPPREPEAAVSDPKVEAGASR